MASLTAFPKSDLTKDKRQYSPFQFCWEQTGCVFTKDYRRTKPAEAALQTGFISWPFKLLYSQQFYQFLASLGNHGGSCKKLLLFFTQKLPNIPPITPCLFQGLYRSAKQDEILKIKNQRINSNLSHFYSLPDTLFEMRVKDLLQSSSPSKEV